MKLIVVNSDHFGATSSGLCMLHCFLTPFLYIFHSTLGIYNELIFFWYLLNYIFLFISFIAVYYSSKKSTNLFVTISLYIFWFLLSGFVINESLAMFKIPEIFTYLSAFSLIFLHIYNLKFCKCKDDECCTS